MGVMSKVKRKKKKKKNRKIRRRVSLFSVKLLSLSLSLPSAGREGALIMFKFVWLEAKG